MRDCFRSLFTPLLLPLSAFTTLSCPPHLTLCLFFLHSLSHSSRMTAGDGSNLTWATPELTSRDPSGRKKGALVIKIHRNDWKAALLNIKRRAREVDEGVELEAFWVCEGVWWAGRWVQGYRWAESGGGKPGILLSNSRRPGGLEL